MSYFVVFIAAFATSMAVAPLAQKLSHHWQILALPGGRRKHEGRIPKLGGVALAAGLTVGFGLALWLVPLDRVSAEFVNDWRRLRGVIFGSLFIFLGGLLDDKYDLPPAAQFIIQFFGATIALSHIIFIETFSNPLSGQQIWIQPRIIALAISLLWLMGILNAVNWLDGLDGLAIGVGAIAALSFAWHSHRLGQTTVAAFPLALAGSLLGLLPYNFAPARIFLGSAGAYLLGYNLATLAILSPAKIATTLLVLALPLLDGLWRIIDRLRQGHNPFKSDRGHLHYRLADSGWPIQRIVLSYYSVALLFGLVAIFAPGSLTKAIALLTLTILLSLVFIFLSRKK